MEITAKMVKELRDQTGAGMMDCKKALAECDCDMEKAVAWLRENGKNKQEKKASRIATEGLVQEYVSGTGQTAVLVEMNIETDFAAKNPEFRSFAEAVARQVAEKKPKWLNKEEVPAGALEESTVDVAAFCKENCLMDMPFIDDENRTVADALSDVFATIGENMRIRRFVRYECGEDNPPTKNCGQLATYIHGGGRVGVMIEINSDSPEANTNEELAATARNLCMQIAAMSPKWLDESDVPSEVLAQEKEIARNAALNDGKPEKIVDKISEGRVKKFVADNTLLGQAYVRDESKSCRQVIEDLAKKLGYNLFVRRFVRYELGEGLEKKEDNFAEEVMKQLNA